MKATNMIRNTRVNLDDMATQVLGVFPTLGLLEQRLSLELYRLLAQGSPVARAALSERLGVGGDEVDRILDDWPGVFSDPQGRVVGYWGLALPEAYASQHRFTIGGRTLSAWCAWDTLFLPQLLGQAAEIESRDPASGGVVRLRVTPQRVEQVDPASAEMSFILPSAAEVDGDVLSSFCHFIHFFQTHEAGENWAAQHDGAFMLSMDEAYALARRKNDAQYRLVLPPRPEGEERPRPSRQ